MSKFQADDQTVLELHQLVKQLVEGPLQFDIVARRRHFAAVAVQPCDSHYPDTWIRLRLASTDRHVFDAPELVISDDVE